MAADTSMLPAGLTTKTYLQSLSIPKFRPHVQNRADKQVFTVLHDSNLRDPRSGRLVWTSATPAGSFRVFPDAQIEKCKPGFFCPENTTQPLPCPGGFVCKSTSAIELCPANFYCPMGSNETYSCGIGSLFSSCPEGTEKPLRYSSFSVIIIVCMFAAYGFYLLGLKEQAKRQLIAHQAKLKELHMAGQGNEQDEDDQDVPPSSPMMGHSANGASDRPRLNIEFDKIGMVLPNGKKVLNGVSGRLEAGRLAAVMGPSGAGKSTLFARLMGKVPASWMEGNVTISGRFVQLHDIASYVGFVPQEDVMIRTLTVDQILSVSARLRLPSGTTSEAVQAKKEEVIQVLGLAGVKDSIIGDEANRGVSGGQRKRVNIGMELVAEPRVLFLDEPTSGLDSSSAFGLCRNLRQLARRDGLVIAAVIHSPSPLAFNEFDDVILLGVGGVLVYAGPVADLPQYLSDIGHPVPRGIPIADHAMDVLQGKTKSTFDANYDVSELPRLWDTRNEWRRNPHVMAEILDEVRRNRSQSAGHNHGKSASGGKSGASKFKGLLSVFKLPVSLFWLILDAFKLLLLCLPFRGGSARATEVGLQPRSPVGFGVSLFTFAKRAFTQAFPSVKEFVGELLMHVVTGTIISFAIVDTAIPALQHEAICSVTPFPQNGVGCQYVITALRQAGAFVSIGVLFAGISVGSQTFGKEIVNFWREQASGLNPVPYFLAKSVIDLIRVLAAAIVFSAALAFAWPYRGGFIGLFTVILALYFVAFGMGYFLSAIIPRERVGLVTTGVSLLFGLILSGALPGLETIDGDDPRKNGYKSEFLNRLPWIISAPRYVTENLYIREAREYPWLEMHESDYLRGTAYYKSNYRTNFGVIIVIGLVWQILAFVALKLVNREKQR